MIVVLGILALASGGLYWFAGSESGLRFTARLATNLTGGKLVVDRVAGQLAGPLQVGILTLDTGEKRFALRDLRLDWSPRDLVERRLLVNNLEASELAITELKPSTEPLTLPDSLALPFALSVPEARLGRLAIRSGGGEVVLDDLRLALAKPASTYRLDLYRLRSPWGGLTGRLELGEDAPFALSGQARFQHPSGAATVGATGTLAQIGLRLDALLAGGEARADLAVTPFAGRPLAGAVVTARGLDPAVWQPGLPKAALDVDARLASQGKDAYGGHVSLANRLNGAWDRERLPLRQASAAFSGNLEGVDLGDIVLDLGQGGRFSGSGRVQADRLQLDLNTRDFDPVGVHSRMRSMKLAGSVGLRTGAGRQDVLADLAWQRYRLHLNARHENAVVQLNEALLSSGAGSLRLFGRVGTSDPRAVDLAGALDGFDPSAFGDYAKGRVNASFTATGQLLPRPSGDLNFAIAESRFRGQPLAGQGRLKLSETRLWDSDVALRLGANQLVLRGAFGNPGDHLAFTVEVPQPQIIHADLSGRLHAGGDLSGKLAEPSGQAEIQAQNLGWGKEYRLDRLDGRLRLERGLDGEMAATARLNGLRLPSLRLDQASLDLGGRRDRHTLKLTARSPDLDLATELAGSLSGDHPDNLAWSGQVVRLSNRGRHAITLLGPAQLELARERMQLADAHLTVLGGRVDVTELRLAPGQMASRGSFRGIEQAALAAVLPLPEELEGNLRLAGEWDLAAGEQVNGSAALWREAGDLVVAAEPRVALGLTALKASARIKDSLLEAQLEGEGSTLGRLRASGQTRLSRNTAGTWGLAGAAPLTGQADLALRSLAWLNPVLDRRGAINVDGSLEARFALSGSVVAPRFQGRIAGEGLRLAWPDEGLDLRGGQLDAVLEQDTLRLRALTLRGGEGTLTLQGRMGLTPANAGAGLDLKAEGLRLVSRPDRLLVVSGTGKLALEQGKLRAEGRVKADRGMIELALDDAPQVSQDVVVLGRPAPQAGKATVPPVLTLALDLDLGEHFYIKGRGLDAQLGGSVRLLSSGNAPLRAIGTIRVTRGAYSAYGQRLQIDRGLLNFQGPLDNPGLNIVALRKNQTVEAGVSLSGTAQAPVVRLVSEPTVPDSDKLSWLVLGHGTADAGTREFDALQMAASALLGAGESVTLQQRIAQATGLEEVSLKGSGTLEGTVLTLGKRLSSKAYLSYEQGLAGTGTLVKAHYALSRRLSVRAQTGTASAVDLFYTFSFD